MRIVLFFNHIYEINKTGREHGLNLRSEIGLGAIYIGTLIGAGFASGQEIMSFFTIYGKKGLLGLAVASTLFFLIGYLIMREAIRKRSQCLSDLLLPLAGAKLTFVYELMADIFSLAGYYIMLSGCGAVLEESFNLNYLAVVLLLNIVIVWCLCKEFSGLAEINKILVSIILVMTVIIAFLCAKEGKNITVIGTQFNKSGWLTSAAVYVSYNTTLAIVVLSALGTYTDRTGAALGAAAIGAFGILFMGGLMWYITWVNYQMVSRVQVPLLKIAKNHSDFLFLSSVIVLLSAMLSTALGLGFSFARSLSRRSGIKYKVALLFLFVGIPLTRYSFTGLINRVYPLFGKLGIIFAILLAIKKVFKY